MPPAAFTLRIMDELKRTGETREPIPPYTSPGVHFRGDVELAQQRIYRAALRLNVKVATEVPCQRAGSFVFGRVVTP